MKEEIQHHSQWQIKITLSSSTAAFTPSCPELVFVNTTYYGVINY